jgi:hypothetical protein
MFKVRVFAIMSGRDDYLGLCFDKTHYLAILDIAKKMGAFGISVHGEINDNTISGEASIENAKEFAN